MKDEKAGARDLVLGEQRGGVRILVLNRPDRLNAWTNELETRYFELLEEADEDPEVRAIVVTGAGRGFCAGADMDGLASVSDQDTSATEKMLRELQRPRTFPLTVRKPLIAAINGATAGIGLVEALYCDLRFATPEAKFTTAFARRGLPAEYGLSWILPRLVGQSCALDLLLSARIFQGEEALRLGLVDRLLPRDRVVDGAVAYATDLAENCSPASMAIIKAQVFADLDRSFSESVAAADDLIIESFKRPDVAEGVKAYTERRAPEFPSLPGRG